MAFPVSPNNGDIYKDFIYDNTNQMWRKKSALDLLGAQGVPNSGGIISTTEIARFEQGSWDLDLLADGVTLLSTYGYKWANYMVINNICFIDIGLSMTSRSAATGQLKMNLPYTPVNRSTSTQWEGALNFFDLIDCFPEDTMPAASDTQDGIIFKKYGGSSTALTTAALLDDPNIRIHGWYEI